MLNKNQKGFTLIELLIVIVIIGILAGVLVAIINPAQQQNRARDANVKATINKVALATQGFISAYGRAPNDVEFLASLTNATDSDPTTPTCDDADAPAAASICMFSVTGNALPISTDTASCAGNGWNNAGGGTGSNCFYRYYRPADADNSTHFRIYAKSYGVANTVFLYTNIDSVIKDCPSNAVGDVDGVECQP